MSDPVVLTVRVERSLKKKLAAYARRQERETGIRPFTVSTAVRQLIAEGLDLASKSGKG